MEKEKLEEAAENYGWRIRRNTFSDAVKVKELAESAQQDFIKGAKWQQEKMYSEEEVVKLLNKFSHRDGIDKEENLTLKWFEQFKKK